MDISEIIIKLKGITMNKKLIKVLVCAVIFCFASGMVFAAEYAVLGRLTPDAMVKKTGVAITLMFTVENQTSKYWLPASVTPQFHYEIFNISTGRQISAGNLIYTKEQYVGPNSSIVFGMVNISTLGLIPGNYRILLFSSEFRNTVNLDRIYIGASTIVRITS